MSDTNQDGETDGEREGGELRVTQSFVDRSNGIEFGTVEVTIEGDIPRHELSAYANKIVNRAREVYAGEENQE